MPKPWLAFFESNTTGTGRLFARAARERGFEPLLLAAYPARYPFLKEDNILFRIADTSSSRSMFHELESLRTRSPIAGIYSSSDYYVGTAADLASKLCLSGPDPAAIAICRNKWRQRVRHREASVPTPKFWRVDSLDGIPEIASAAHFPVVVKPTEGSGSVGVKLCHTLDEVREHGALLLARTQNERGLPLPAEFLIEQYVRGPEFSVETFGTTVIGITAKHVSPEPWFVETGHDFPAPVDAEQAQAISCAALGALRAVGLDWGPAHTEVRWSEQGSMVMEINSRLAGGFIPKLIEDAFGIDLIGETVALVSGETPELSPSRNARSSIRFLLCGEDGVVPREIPSRADDGNVRKQVEYYKAPGERCQIYHDFRDRVGHVITTCETP
jgi:S-sulfo-L-cysteine synthase (3-phospho-L-serine-dependent)